MTLVGVQGRRGGAEEEDLGARSVEGKRRSEEPGLSRARELEVRDEFPAGVREHEGASRFLKAAERLCEVREVEMRPGVGLGAVQVLQEEHGLRRMRGAEIGRAHV